MKTFIKNSRKNLIGYVFVAPFIIGAVFFFIPSIAESLWYSFNDVKIDYSNINQTFVGIQNYTNAFTGDITYRVILSRAASGMLVDTLIILIFSFFVASLLNQKFLGRGVARMVFFLPVILTTGIVAAVESGNVTTNTLNAVSTTVGEFDTLGLSMMFRLDEYLLSTGINRSVVSVIVYAVDNTFAVVNSSGVQILVFISALQGMQPSLFEAAKVEGATKWEEFWKITFPMLTPVIFVNIVYSVIDTFTNPIYEVMSYIRNSAFVQGSVGYASALSWIYFGIVLVVLGVITLVINKRIQYLD